jgi:hypothetical protein
MRDLDDDFELQPTRDRSALLWNILTVLVLIGVVCIAGVFLSIFIDPRSSLNPFPPPTLPPKFALPTVTPSIVPPTWTPTNTSPPTATDTPRATLTIQPSPTMFTLATLYTDTPTPPPTVPPAGYSFELQGKPYAIKNLYHPELECAWMGVGGQALDMSGAHVTGLIIRLGGVLSGVSLNPMMSLTGVALNYGQSGYEFTLADRPIASKGTLWIQLLDQAGLPLSDKIPFDTYDSCEQNLILINFKQVR